MANEILTEDQVRDKAKEILGFENTETTKSGVGQLTSWKSLGFNGVSGAPDGWYLPNERSFPAIILEVKGNKIALKQQQIDEVQKNCKIVLSKYKNVLGILYNGSDILVYQNGKLVKGETELRNKEYYLGLFSVNKIDKQKIFSVTKRINDSLHFNFGIKNLYHRMIFTACALVAKRYGSVLVKDMSYNSFRNSIFDTLSKSYADAIKQNTKLNFLLDVYSEIKMNITENQEAINNFIEDVSEISDNINSDFWNGEDVMAIFFNEFNRYKKKSEQGQVFTPDNVTSLMYRIIDVNKDDTVLDAACGSGAFLVKAMCNMVKEAGGIRTTKAKEIKQKQLYGIEFDREVFALACANMLIHKDGKTNLEQLDSRSKEAAAWMKSKSITKVLMNPPFENKYGCLDIVHNVLDSVGRNVPCAFIMPDNKLETNESKAKRILKAHRLEKIIKLPKETFSGVTASIFIFRAGVAQNGEQIFACYIENDGLETVKNQGRQDVKERWQGIEDYWVDVIKKHSGNKTIQWLNPDENLSYKLPEPPFQINESDFRKAVLDYVLYENKIDKAEFQNKILDFVLYGIDCAFSNKRISDFVKLNSNNEEQNTFDLSGWKDFKLSELFEISRPKARVSINYNDGKIPFIASGNFDNGIEKYVGAKNDEELDKGNCITVSPVDGSAFYQKRDFLGRGGAGSSILKLYNKNLNEFNALFLCAVIRKICSKYNYANMCSAEKIKKEIIRLPAKNGNPDFQYMEGYIKKIYESKKIIIE